MKQRFSALDIRLVAIELSKTIVGHRLQNIFDVEAANKVFLLKFALPDSKQFLLLDSGFRAHLTDFSRTTAPAPSNFVVKLRKHLRTRRLTSIQQVETDRVLVFTFGDGLYYLVVEFYAAGNILLLDQDQKVLTLIRVVPEGPSQKKCAVGEMYDLGGSISQKRPDKISSDDVFGWLSLANSNQLGEEEPAPAEQKSTWPDQPAEKLPDGAAANKKKKKKKSKANPLKKALSRYLGPYLIPSVLVESVLIQHDLDPNSQVGPVEKDDAFVNKVYEAIHGAQVLISQIIEAPQIKGYIFSKRNPAPAPKDDSDIGDYQAFLYEDFHPFVPIQYERSQDIEIIEVLGYNKTIDKFFSSIESNKINLRLSSQQLAAERRLESARNKNLQQLSSLQREQEINFLKGNLLEGSSDLVEEAMRAVNVLRSQGMDWKDMEQLIKVEQSRGNEIAEVISLPLKLKTNTITLLLNLPDEDLDEEDLEEDEEEKEQDQEDKKDTIKIDVDLDLSTFANARRYYEARKSAANKEAKTAQQSQIAIKNAERKINQDLKKTMKQEKQVLRPIRRKFWFEKFLWFISSDGYLVLGARDDQQADLLYYRHFAPKDVFVFSDVPGAVPVIVKKRASSRPEIPYSTLTQAGVLSVSMSKAWDQKIVTSGYSVSYEQVSKQDFSGASLSPGRFEIQGKKNFLPPAQLVMGFGFLFLVDEDSACRHARKQFQEEDQNEVNTDNAVPESDTGDKYKLDEYSQDNESMGGESAIDRLLSSQQPVGMLTYQKPRTPAHKRKEARDNKKQNDKNGETGERDDDAEISKEVEESVDDATQNLENVKISDDEEDLSQKPVNDQNTGKSVRGKKGKLRKIAKKYADQDEEDRRLRMELLGSTRGEERLKQKEEEDRERKAIEEEQKFQKQAKRRAEEVKRLEKVESLKALQAEKIKQLDGQESEDADESSLTNLDALVGRPQPQDVLLEAIPVCAPWQAMGSQCKFKAKMLPGGNVKKGKAVKTLLGHFLGMKLDPTSQDPDRLWPREKELIANVKDTDMMLTIGVSKVKITIDTKKGSKK